MTEQQSNQTTVEEIIRGFPNYTYKKMDDIDEKNARPWLNKLLGELEASIRADERLKWLYFASEVREYIVGIQMSEKHYDDWVKELSQPESTL